jgi:head-tail adaptor
MHADWTSASSSIAARSRRSPAEKVESWPLLKEVWAAVDGAKASGAEPNAGDGIKSQRDYTVWVRADIVKRLAITLVDRIYWKGKVLNIKDMPDQQLRGRWIAIICNTGLNAG